MSTENIQVLLEKLKHLSEKIDEIKTNQQIMNNDMKSFDKKLMLVEENQRERNCVVLEVKQEILEINKFIDTEKAKNNFYSKMVAFFGGGKTFIIIIIALLLLVDWSKLSAAFPKLMELFGG